ncbi:MAG: hypothetical protein JO098_00680 [Candidatus Eremiobacteraeota bacterium]|nr:hypothetical protein [Candidatus Eremiobacteraeota bacterium]
MQLVDRRLLSIILASCLLAAGAASQARSAPQAEPSATATSTASAGDVSAAMVKYAAAIGGRSLMERIHTQVSVFTFPLLGRTMVVKTTTKTPCFFLQETQAQGGTGKITIGFDGKTAWTQGPDGTTTTLTGEKRAEVVSEAAGGNTSEVFPDRWPTQVTLKPDETHDGKTYVVLAIMPKDGLTHDILLDAHTYQPMVERSHESDVAVISIVNSFSKGPLGELQAQSVTTTRSDGFPQVTATLQTVRDNDAVDDAIFAPPLGKGGVTI